MLNRRLAMLFVVAVCGGGGRVPLYLAPLAGDFLLQANSFRLLLADGGKIKLASSQ